MPRQLPFATYAQQSHDDLDHAASPLFEVKLMQIFDLWSHRTHWDDAEYAIAGRMHADAYVAVPQRSSAHWPSARQRVRYHLLGGTIASGHGDWATAYEQFGAALSHVAAEDVLTRLVILYEFADVSANVQDFLQSAACWERIVGQLSELLRLDIEAPLHPYLRASLCEAHTFAAYFALALGNYDAIAAHINAALHLLFSRIRQAGVAVPLSRADYALPFSPWDALAPEQDLATTLGTFLKGLPSDPTGLLWQAQAVMMPWVWALWQFYQQRLQLSDYSSTYPHSFHLISQLAEVYIAHGGAVGLHPGVFTLLMDIPFAGLQEAPLAGRTVWGDMLAMGYAQACRCWDLPALADAVAPRYLKQDGDLMLRYSQMRVAGSAPPQRFLDELARFQEQVATETRLPFWGNHLIGKAHLMRGIIALDAGHPRAAKRAFAAALDVFTEKGIRKPFMPRQHEIERLWAATSPR